MTTNWAITKKQGLTELRAKFSSTGNRFAQVLVKISMEGVEPRDDFSSRMVKENGETNPQVVISMNGQAGMSFADYQEMVKQIDAAIVRAVVQTTRKALGAW